MVTGVVQGRPGIYLDTGDSHRQNQVKAWALGAGAAQVGGGGVSQVGACWQINLSNDI